jgi:hypothetical protein
MKTNFWTKVKKPISMIIILVFFLVFGFIIPRIYFYQNNQNLGLDISDNVIICINQALSTQVSALQFPPRLFRYIRPKSIIPIIAVSYKSHSNVGDEVHVQLNTYTFFGIRLGQYTYTSCYRD